MRGHSFAVLMAKVTLDEVDQKLTSLLEAHARTGPRFCPDLDAALPRFAAKWPLRSLEHSHLSTPLLHTTPAI